MAANAAYTWVQTHLRKPFMMPLGTVKRRGKSGSNVVSDRLALRTSIFLCLSCEHKMPRAWLRHWEYRLIPNMHAEATRCDSCQQIGYANIFHPEDGAYYREHIKLQTISRNAAKVQVAVREGRRIVEL